MGDGGIRVCLVTGATGAIGKAIARQIAGRPDTEVVLACRDEKKAGQTVREIVETTGNPRVRYELVDVGFAGHQTPDEGARTPVWLAMEPIGHEQSGKYFEQIQAICCPFAADRESMNGLHEACLRY